MKKRLNIGIDIDDTITNTYYSMLPVIAMKYNVDYNKLKENKYGYSKLHDMLPDYIPFCRKYNDKVLKVVSLKDDVKEIINKLNAEGHRIVIITARDNIEFEDAYKFSYEYLCGFGIKFDKLIVNAKDKAKVCLEENIDLFIDDNRKNCIAVNSSGVPTLQYYNDFIDEIRGIDRVYSWRDVYKRVQEMDG